MMTMMLIGAGAAPVNFQACDVSDFELSPTNGVAAIQFTSAGVVNETGNTGGAAPAFTWLRTGAGADFDIRVSLTGDTGSLVGTLGTWQNLGSTRSWQLTATGATVRTVTGSYEISRAGMDSPLGSAGMTMSAVSDT